MKKETNSGKAYMMFNQFEINCAGASSGSDVRCPKLKKDAPNIISLNDKKTYICFSLNDLFNDLFFGSKVMKPIIKTDNFKRCNKKELLLLILPEEILKRFLNIRNKKGRRQGQTYIIESSSNNDYKGLFTSCINNNKITGLLHEEFSRGDGKELFRIIQNHIINNLRHINLENSEELISYLKTVGDNAIVPASISISANTEFNNLLGKHDHFSISKILANFFISALFGLWSLEFTGGYQKTYLLNSNGMEYIWTPEKITSTYEMLMNADQLYIYGHYSKAYQSVLQWLDEYSSSANTKEIAKAYQIAGLCMYLHPDDYVGTLTDESDIKARGLDYLESCVEMDKTLSDVSFLLYRYYSEDSNEEGKTIASHYLTNAFDMDNANAIAEMARLYIGEDIDSVDLEKILIEKLNKIIDNVLRYSNTEVGECLYYRGIIRKRQDDIHGSEADFIAAAQRGHEKARCEISRKHRLSQMYTPQFISENSARLCFANSLTGKNLSTLTTFPSNEWTVYSTDIEENTEMGIMTVDNIDDYINMLNLKMSAIERAIFLFMSDDENKNLNECLITLDKLFNSALDLHEEHKWQLIDKLDIYVSAKHESASTLLDACIDDMGNDIYFKVHIIDNARDSARRLLCDAPLFIPFLNKSEKAKTANVVLFGSTETNYSIIKEIMACAYMGDEHPITITMFGEKSKRYEKIIHRECSGIFKKDVPCVIPEFIECALTEEDFPSYIYGHDFEKSHDDLRVQVLERGNYFIVDLDDDLSSIQFAMDLRTWLLRSRGTFDRAPFIAVKCSDIRNSYLVDHLTVSGQTQGDSYYSRYNLFAYGMSKQIYSYERMIEKPLIEETALRIHKSYYGENKKQAENDYYSYSYNSDSSICTAIGLSYRLFAGGVYFDDGSRYLNNGIFEAEDLFSKYADWASNSDNLEKAAACEQNRWNGYMMTRGWESASFNQVQAYKNQSTGSSHKHKLAKLHPFIRQWSDLEDEKIRNTLGILKTKFNYKKSPQETTRQSIRDTVNFIAKSCAKSKDDEQER